LFTQKFELLWGRRNKEEGRADSAASGEEGTLSQKLELFWGRMNEVATHSADISGSGENIKKEEEED